MGPQTSGVNPEPHMSYEKYKLASYEKYKLTTANPTIGRHFGCRVAPGRVQQKRRTPGARQSNPKGIRFRFCDRSKERCRGQRNSPTDGPGRGPASGGRSRQTQAPAQEQVHADKDRVATEAVKLKAQGQEQAQSARDLASSGADKVKA